MPLSNLDSVVSVRFTSKEVERLKNEADAEGVSVSNLVRKASLAYLSRRSSGVVQPRVPSTTGSESWPAVTFELGESQVAHATVEPEFYPIND